MLRECAHVAGKDASGEECVGGEGDAKTGRRWLWYGSKRDCVVVKLIKSIENSAGVLIYK